MLICCPELPPSPDVFRDLINSYLSDVGCGLDRYVRARPTYALVHLPEQPLAILVKITGVAN
jgi:hypothetical protein